MGGAAARTIVNRFARQPQLIAAAATITAALRAIVRQAAAELRRWAERREDDGKNRLSSQARSRSCSGGWWPRRRHGRAGPAYTNRVSEYRADPALVAELRAIVRQAAAERGNGRRSAGTTKRLTWPLVQPAQPRGRSCSGGWGLRGYALLAESRAILRQVAAELGNGWSGARTTALLHAARNGLTQRKRAAEAAAWAADRLNLLMNRLNLLTKWAEMLTNAQL
jgi:hypothetical protein